MNLNMNLKMLMALRTQLDAIQIVVDGLIEAAISEASTDTQGECKHDGAIDVSTFGHVGRKYCKACKAEFYANHSDGAVLTGANEGGSQHG